MSAPHSRKLFSAERESSNDREGSDRQAGSKGGRREKKKKKKKKSGEAMRGNRERELTKMSPP